MVNPIRAGLEMRDAHFPGRAQIEAYGNGGFRFAGMSHRGSVLMLPSGIYGWEPVTFADVTAQSLAKVVADADAIEVILLGCGKDLLRVPDTIRALLADVGIKVEQMSTGAAVRTYNVLLAEDRAVAAALIAVDEA